MAVGSLHLEDESELLDRVKWITDAVASQKIGVNALNSYLLRNGKIHASDGRMVVGTPFPFGDEAVLVPAKEFERVLGNKPEGPFDWLFEPDRLVLKRGRFKGRIKTLPVDDWVWPIDSNPKLQDVPIGLVAAFEKLLPFVSENATKPWATCIGIIGDDLFASNNIVVACVPCATGAPTPEYLVPRWVAEFVVKRAEGLDQWACDENTITFTWEDGSWMRSALIMDQFPPVQKVMEAYFIGVPDVEMTKEWKKALRRVARITEDAVVKLREHEVVSESGEVLSVEDDAGTPVPEGMTESRWDIRFLDPILDIATHWNPRLYPKAAPWIGPGIKGIILGTREQGVGYK